MRKSRHKITIGDVTYGSLKAVTDAYGLPYKPIEARICRGWEIEKALLTPVKRPSKPLGRVA